MFSFATSPHSSFVVATPHFWCCCCWCGGTCPFGWWWVVRVDQQLFCWVWVCVFQWRCWVRVVLYKHNGRSVSSQQQQQQLFSIMRELLCWCWFISVKFGGDTDENFCCAFEYFNGRGRVVVDTLTLLDYYGWRYGFTRCFLKSVSSILGVYESECFWGL